jgi:hypothetical protein
LIQGFCEKLPEINECPVDHTVKVMVRLRNGWEPDVENHDFADRLGR